MFLAYQFIILLGVFTGADAVTQRRTFLHIMHGPDWVSYKVSVNQGRAEKYLVKSNDATANLKCPKYSFKARYNVVGVDCERDGNWESIYCEIKVPSTNVPPQLKNCGNNQDTVITYAALDLIPSGYLNTWDV